jgi:hypothetical protein
VEVRPAVAAAVTVEDVVVSRAAVTVVSKSISSNNHSVWLSDRAVGRVIGAQ